jgi:hypothetical protein
MQRALGVPVRCTDEPCGDGDGLITHVALERGHLWTKRDVTMGE